MARKPTRGKASNRQVTKSPLPDGLINEAPIAYPVADTSITALQVYHNPDRKPSDDGPWDQEADKVAWLDEETGLGCIMLRQPNGTISGYVGIGPEHPLFGFEADAVPVDVSNVVHGGVTYGKACEVNRFAREAYGKPRQERYTVCHVTRVRLVQEYRTVQTTKDEFDHEDLWWLGFDTDHPGDLIPAGHRNVRRRGDVYRDQSYVYGQCVELARRLKSLANAAEQHSDGGKQPQLPPPHDNVGGAA
ncbi:hypothetical protein [Erythrobacter sp. QSSC1-22B]|uniref:hypothetical protein n=1 Tax=Erythrobacter sp. QSSC1-22B TaxID=1860125 RepID=UPI0011A11A65|nr:hypothetical protein [Erythrobacter sp. QSSC1-22B]